MDVLRFGPSETRDVGDGRFGPSEKRDVGDGGFGPGGLAVTLSAQDRDYKQSAHAQSLEELDRALNSDPLPRRANSHPLVPLPNPFAAVTKPFHAVKNPFAGMRSPFAHSTTTRTEQAAGGISHGYLPRQLSWATERKPVSSSV